MKRLIIAAFALAFAFPAIAQVNSSDKADRLMVMNIHNDALYDSSTFVKMAPLLMADATTATTTKTETPTAPASVTTTVKGGTLAAQVLEWFQVALVPVLGGALVGLLLKGMAWLGIQTTSQQSDQLQKIAMNGINDAMAKAESSLKNNPALDINVKNQVVADAVKYTQDHAAETIKALGLDPQSGKAVEAIRAKIATALNDPSTPTPAAITPKSAGGVA